MLGQELGWEGLGAVPGGDGSGVLAGTVRTAGPSGQGR